METLVQQAQDKKYADFDSQAKAILSQKVATALAATGYFDRLNQARGIQEGENPFAKKEKEEKEDKVKDDKEEIKGDFKKMKKDAGTDKEKEDEKEVSKDLKKEKEDKEDED